jgi:excisionase family DNA binding protein
MSTLDRARDIPFPPLDPGDRERVQAARQCIEAALARSRSAAITLTTDTGERQTVEVPPRALGPIGQLLGLMGEGYPVVLLPAEREFTTVEAANFLNVSRPFLVKEIDAGRLPCRKVGSHRRIAMADLLAYARRMRARQVEALQRMADNARELGLEY